MSEIGEFVPPVQSQEDSVQAQQVLGHPLAVKVHEIVENKRSEHAPDGKPAIFLDVWDLAQNQVYCGVMWMNPAVVDKLRGVVGDGKVYPIKLVEAYPKNGGKAYYTPVPLEGQEKDVALQWLNSQVGQGIFERTRAERGYGPYGTTVGSLGSPAAAPQPQFAPPPGAQAPQQPQFTPPQQPAAMAPPQQPQFGAPQQPAAMAPPVQQPQMQQPPAGPPAMAPPAGAPQLGAMAAGNGYGDPGAAPAFGAPPQQPPAQPNWATPAQGEQPPF